MSELLEVAKRLKENSSDRKEDMKRVYEKGLKELELSLKHNLHSKVNELNCYTESELNLMMKKQKETITCFKNYLDETMGELRKDLSKTRYVWNRTITKSVIVGLSISAGLFLGTFGTMKYLTWSTTELWHARNSLQMEIAQLESKGAWGLSYQETKDGRFITIPAGYSGDWTCGEKPCVKINK